MIKRTLTISALALMLTACGGMQKPGTLGGSSAAQRELPARIRVPGKERAVMEAHGVGQVVYECQAQENAMAQGAWVEVSVEAELSRNLGLSTLRHFFGPPAVWDSSDGSKAIGNVTATMPAPRETTDLAYQLVKIHDTKGNGVLSGISHVQRIDTRGGAAPRRPCNASTGAARETQKFEADYVFYSDR